MFAIVDIETTGNVYKYGKITEIAIISFDGSNVTDVFQTLINPEIDIPYRITQLTGIDNNMVKNSPKFYEVARKIVELTAGKVFVAHNVQFDYKFIQEEFKRLGYDFERKKICTVKLSRKLMPGLPSYSLGNICMSCGINNNARHRAAGDALATAELFNLLLKIHHKQNMNPEGSIQSKLF